MPKLSSPFSFHFEGKQYLSLSGFQVPIDIFLSPINNSNTEAEKNKSS